MFLPFLFGVLLQVPRQIAVRSERVLRVDGDANLSVVDSKYVDKIAVNVLVQRVHDTTVDSPKFSAEIDLSFQPWLRALGYLVRASRWLAAMPWLRPHRDSASQKMLTQALTRRGAVHDQDRRRVERRAGAIQAGAIPA